MANDDAIMLSESLVDQEITDAYVNGLERVRDLIVPRISGNGTIQDEFCQGADWALEELLRLVEAEIKLRSGGN